MTLVNSLNVIIKPTNACNMRCVYCYHAERGYDSFELPLDLLSDFCLKTFPFFKRLHFIWHGGEPLLMGLDFFKDAFDLIELHRKRYNNILTQSVQTNGTLIDKDWVLFFKDKDIGVGLSFDGKYNDNTRGCAEKILSAIRLLQAQHNRVGVIHVSTNYNITHIEEDYEYYKANNISVKFNYVFDTVLHNALQFTITVDEYVKKMSAFFDHWFYDSTCRIAVNPFEEYIRLIVGSARSCEFSSCLTKWICIDANGCLTPCGRNYPDNYKLGSIADYNNILDVFKSDKYLDLLSQAIARRNVCKSCCEVFKYCRGGCNNNMLMEHSVAECGGFHCECLRRMLLHAEDVLFCYKNSSVDKKSINPRAREIIEKSL